MESANKNILLFGSGMMVLPLLEYLTKREENYITMATNILPDGQKLAAKVRNTTAVEADVTNVDMLRDLIKGRDLVISYVPPPLHPPIARTCVELGVHMLTASYVSDTMRELDPEAKKKGVILFNEIGLDPGIDILATFKVVDEVEEKGGKILSYESYCGGLPSPDSYDNPFGYKFSWAPQGAMRAMGNPAIFLKDGERVEIEKGTVMRQFEPMNSMHPTLKMEGFPNRNSIQYKEEYRLHDTKTLIRGTLRYPGFCVLIGSLIDLGLWREIEIPDYSADMTFTQLLKKELADEDTPESPYINSAINALNIEDAELAKKIISKAKANLSILRGEKEHDIGVRRPATIKAEEFSGQIYHVLKTFIWLGFFDNKTILKKNNYFLSICEELMPKLALLDGDKDMIFLQNIFQIEWKDGSTEQRFLTLFKIGDKDRTAMSQCVATPSAVAAQMILDGKVKARGNVIPNSKEIYGPILEKLQEVGIKIVEESA